MPRKQKGGWVYLICSPNHSTLYTGVTSDLYHRILEHRTHYYPRSFTARYNCIKLVYYAFFEGIEEAIEEEKRIKTGSRWQKERLIRSLNPDWLDLWETEVQFW